ncbi:MAG: hypothetical protein A3E82_04585 [Gammaproteobacteria bacterium RIFCSPHIGHO2_12_FULL_38_11]|nr:MAG: hypothetical protein A3E82_04585 [Gammaproteobacteria bacterium RIFCSPHIGHO2_12_FULL_38_11]
MRSAMAYFFQHFPMCMTVLALIFGVFCCFFKKDRSCSDMFLGKLMFFAVGLTGLWGFVVHAFFPDMAAKFIGWAASPFQFEVAVANLGMGVAGVFGVRATKSYRIATTIFTTCFLWGAAYGHCVQMQATANFAPGNAGSIFYNDIILPVLLIFFLLSNKCKSCEKVA